MPLVNERAVELGYNEVYYTYVNDENATELVEELDVQFVPLFVYVKDGKVERTSTTYTVDNINDLVEQFLEADK